MSDVPLTKKMFFETEDAWGIPYTRFDVMKVKDVVDALRKFQDLIKSRAKYHLNNIETKRQCFLEDKKILYLFKEIFGVLDSQDDFKKEVKK